MEDNRLDIQPDSNNGCSHDDTMNGKRRRSNESVVRLEGTTDTEDRRCDGNKNKTTKKEHIKKDRKKPRHSREQKRTAKAQREKIDIPITRKQAMKEVLRVLGCAHQSKATQSVKIVSSSEGPATQRTDLSSVRIISTVDIPMSIHEDNKSIITMNDDIVVSDTVYINPLLILDLNGVLCHRVRRHKQPPDSIPYLRPSVGIVSNTPIIERPGGGGGGGVEHFLRLLMKHFCVAIWTSANMKTAKDILKLLIPDDNIKSRLLFVWAKDECTVVNDDTNIDDDTEEVVFEKDLTKVWKRFPLWTPKNTLLVDDSPEKCCRAIGNSIHPIPLHGQVQQLGQDHHESPQSNCGSRYVPPNLSDEENCERQEQFFLQLVRHFKDHPDTRDVVPVSTKTTLSNVNTGAIQQNQSSLRNFLEMNTKSTFGWRGDEH